MKIIAVYLGRNILVCGQVAFYQSTGTSGLDTLSSDINQLRGGTHFPFFGVTPEPHMIKSTAITWHGPSDGRILAPYEESRGKIGSGPNAPDLLCDDQLFDLYKRQLITDDMAGRFRFYDALVISAMLGGGFWESENGKQIISELKVNRPEFKPVAIENNAPELVISASDVSESYDRGRSRNAQSLNHLLRKHGALLSGYASDACFNDFYDQEDDRMLSTGQFYAYQSPITLKVKRELDPQTLPLIFEEAVQSMCPRRNPPRTGCAIS